MPTVDVSLLAVACFMLFVIVLSIIGNTIVLCVYIRNGCLNPVLRSYVISLTAFDICGPLVATWMTPYSVFTAGTWQFGRTGCILHSLVLGTCGMSSLYIQTCIALQRCYAIVKPVQISRPETSRVRFQFSDYRKIAGIAVFSFLLMIPPVFGWGSIDIESGGITCGINMFSRSTNNVSYLTFLLIVGFLIPVPVLLISYATLCWKFRKWLNNRPVATGSLTRASVSVSPTVNLIAILSGMALLVAWTPYALLAFINLFGYLSYLPNNATTFAAVFAKAANVYNPIVYAVFDPNFRSSLIKTVPRMENVTSMSGSKLLKAKTYAHNNNKSEPICKKPELLCADFELTDLSPARKEQVHETLDAVTRKNQPAVLQELNGNVDKVTAVVNVDVINMDKHEAESYVDLFVDGMRERNHSLTSEYSRDYYDYDIEQIYRDAHRFLFF